MANEKKTFQGKIKVLSNQRVAPGHYVIKFHAPLLTKVTHPGQFVQIQIEDGLDPLLRRPFSILSALGSAIEILYAVVGKGTELLSKKKRGESVDVLGPLGNSWSPLKPNKTAILIGGGVGIPPLYFFAEEQKKYQDRIEVFLGARHRSLLLCQGDFLKLGIQPHVATDDGSDGFKGYVTDLLKQWLQERSKVEGRRSKERQKILNFLPPSTFHLPPYLYACGPESMLKAVALVAKKFHIDGEVSMEAPMACGLGICVGCAIPVVGGGYKMCCYDGTVFKIDEVDWRRYHIP